MDGLKKKYLITLFLLLIIVDFFINSKLGIILYMILLPGYLIILRKDKLNPSKTIIEVIIIGCSVLIYYSTYLSYFRFEINSSNLMILNTLLSLFLIIIKRKTIFIRINDMAFFKYTKKDVLEFLFLLIILTTPILLYKNIISHEYYMGIDPYQQIIDFRSISEQSNILQSKSYNNPFYGFYFFIYSITQLIGINYHIFTKYFWLINTSLILGTIYIILINKSKIAFTSIIPIVFLSNPFVMNRFVMSIRENFSFLFLLGLVFYLNEKEKGKVVEMAILYGAVILTHPITFLYASAVLVFYFFIEYVQRDKAYLTTLKVFLGLIFSFPMLNILIEYFVWFIQWKIQIGLGFSYVPPHPGGLSAFDVLRAWTKPIEITDFSKYVIYAAPLGLLSYIYEIYKIRSTRFLFIFPWSILTLFMVILTELGFYQSPSRLIIYIAFSLSFFSGILIENTYKMLSNRIFTLKINSKAIKLPSTFIDNKLYSILLAFIILLPMMFTSLNYIQKFTKYSPFEKNQIDGVNDFISGIGNETYILLPYPEEIAMFIYLDTSHTIINYSQLVEIYNSYNLDMIKHRIMQYEDVNNIYFIISGINLHGHYPLLQLLETNFKKITIKGIIIYQYNYPQ